MHACAPVLEEHFNLVGNKSRNAGKVLKWFKEGVTMKFVGVDHHSHQHIDKQTDEYSQLASQPDRQTDR